MLRMILAISQHTLFFGLAFDDELNCICAKCSPLRKKSSRQDISTSISFLM
jgi:hypothetical protein